MSGVRAEGRDLEYSKGEDEPCKLLEKEREVMKLYEINEKLEALIQQLEPDEDGVYERDPEEVGFEIMNLEAEKQKILEWLVKVYLNQQAEGQALKAEETRLSDKRKRLEAKNERLLNFIDRQCGGEKTDCGVATVKYTRTEATEIIDKEKLVSWLELNNGDDCLKYLEPEIRKPELKKLIKSGAEVPYAAIIGRTSCSIK